MRLGVIGWYGYSNYGDERILYCIKRFFSSYNFFVARGWPDARLQINELNQCDFILIGGGGLILRDIGQYTDIIRALRKPFGFIGVSIEAKHNSMDEFLEVMKEKAEFIVVRDRQSKKYLDNHSEVVVGPDLTFLYPFHVVSEAKEDICGFNLRGWHYWKGTFYGNYWKLMSKLSLKSGRVLKKVYPFTKWDPKTTVSIVKKKFQNVLAIPLHAGAMQDVDVLSAYFKNVPSQFNIDLYNNLRYLIGMRFHSIVFATQCGIPFVSLSYQPKNDTFCSDMGLNMLSMDIYKTNELESKIDYVKNHHQQIREHLILYREKCIQKIKHIFQSISYLIK